MRHYATACRAAEIPVLLASMRRHCRPFVLHLLAWDFPIGVGPDIRSQPEAVVSRVTREEFLAWNPEYAPDRLPGPPRSPIDQVCTARWRFVADLVRELGEPVTMIDGDIWFWSSPEPEAFRQLDDGAKLVVCSHRFPPAELGLPGVTRESHSRYGQYNAGFIQFGDPEPAEAMAQLTLEWSHTEVLLAADGKAMFGDQGHLQRVASGQEWPHQAGDLRVMGAAGVNVAPWNIHTRKLEERDGQVLVDGEPLIAYHYSSFRRGGSEQAADPCYEITPEQSRILYDPYRRAWDDANR